MKFLCFVLGLALLGGCALLEGCPAYYQAIGTLTRAAAETTLNLSIVSHALIKAIDANGGSIITGLADEGDGWYSCAPFGDSFTVYLNAKDTGGTNLVIGTLPNLSSVKHFRVKLDEQDAGASVLCMLVWADPATAPEATGNMTYEAGGGSCSADFYELTTDTDGYTNHGSTEMVWNTNNPIFSNFNVRLTFNSDATVDGTMGANASFDDLGTVRMTPNKPFPPTPPETLYDIVLINSKGEEIPIGENQE